MSSEVPYRNITDPRTLRALTHPVRLALLDALDQEGPLTATQAGELIDESPANASFHLRTLAKYGFVEEAEGGRGRQRPWRIRREVSRVQGDELTPEGKIAVQALVGLLHEREQEYQDRWLASRDSYPSEWRAAAGEMHLILHLTAAELDALSAVISAAVLPYAGREDVPDTLPVAISAHMIPLRLPHPSTPTPPAAPATPTPPATPAAPTTLAARARPRSPAPPASPAPPRSPAPPAPPAPPRAPARPAPSAPPRSPAPPASPAPPRSPAPPAPPASPAPPAPPAPPGPPAPPAPQSSSEPPGPPAFR